MRYISYVILVLCLGVLAGCGNHRDPVGRMPADLPNVFTKPQAEAAAASSTAAQSAEIAPLVKTGVVVGGLAATAAIALGGLGLATPKMERTGVLTGGFLVIASLMVQRALPYIPYALAALAIGGAAYAAIYFAKHNRTIKGLWLKDRSKLCTTAAKLAPLTGASALADEIHKDITAHLADNKV